MFENLRFFNSFGNGDLFNSREFVKELIEKIPAENYYYHHSKSERMFQDIPKLKSVRVTERCFNDRGFSQIGNDLYINTWIGRDSKYVLPGVGCTIAMNLRMYNEILNQAGLDIRLSKELIDYIPTIDFTKLDNKYLDNINKFVEKYSHKRKILWSTGHVQSNQAINFDFEPMINIISGEYSDILFIVTEPSGVMRKNIHYTGDIIKSEDGFDLNEISYLSLFTDTFIGKPAGPFVFAQNKLNMLNDKKALLAFSYSPNCISLALTFVTPIMKVWSNASDIETVCEHIRKVIDR